MKKFFTVLLIVLAVCSSAFGAKYLSVSVDDPCYRIIENASYRGIIENPSSVKPYTYTQVKNLLTEIKVSGLLNSEEIGVIDATLARLASRYGESDTNSFMDVLKNGYYKYEKGDSNLYAGVTFSSNNRVGYKVDDGKILDSRNVFTFALKGDLFNAVSVNANLGLEVMKVNTDAYLFHDTPFFARANYWELPRDDAWDISSDSHIIYGVGAYPEIASSLLDGKLSLRFGTVSRDWGPADNNLDLASTTAAMSGFEVNVTPFDWFEYSVLHASAASLMMKTYAGIDWADDEGYQEAEYDNNFSIHRIDLTFGNLDIGLYESNIWRKRFELGYLAPFGIVQILQNETGNYDNMIFGADVAYTVKGMGKIYAAISVDEISSINIKHFITDPRHIFAFQAGISVDGKLGNFSVLSFQATYIPPFYGAHYTVESDVNPWGDVDYETSYVSGGKNIFYPVDPDTIELKMAYDVALNRKIDLNVTLRDQMRSAQYAVNTTNGTDIFTSINYDHAEEYEYKKPWKYIWKNTLIVDADADYKFSGIPLTLTLGITGKIEWTRDYTIDNLYRDGDTRFNDGKYNLGSVTFGDWNTPEVLAMANIGIKVYL
ncbi:MAG: hypothetical protein K6F82_00755 [Sphaerochaetaceae bacterium]|nr:hypothetical protein [Sphaerochaetaceae bacterium]